MSLSVTFIYPSPDEWAGSKNASIIRLLATELSQDPCVKVSFLMPNCSLEDKQEAEENNIKVVETEEFLDFNSVDWLAFPPENLSMDFVVFHNVKIRWEGKVISDHLLDCKWTQVVHTCEKDTGLYVNYPGAISMAHEEHKNQVKLCEHADIVLSIGKVMNELTRDSCSIFFSAVNIVNLTPGIFEEFWDIPACEEFQEKNTFNILIFGRGDAEDFKLKGFDVAAKAVVALYDSTYRLIVVGAPDGEQGELAAKLQSHTNISHSQLIVKRFCKNKKQLADIFREVDLVLMPSGTESFGLAALEALSAGLPILVTSNSGLAEALRDVPLGSQCIVDVEADWAKEIKKVQKNLKTRQEEAKKLREKYKEKYSWKKQCAALVQKMQSMHPGSHVKTEVTDVKTQVEDVGSDVKNVKTQVKFVNTQVKGVGSDVKYVKTEVTDVKTKDEDVASVVKDAKTEVTDVMTQLKDVGSDVKDVKTEVTDVMTQLIDVGSDVEDVKVTVVMTRLIDVGSDVKGVKTEVTDVMTQLKDVGSDVEDVKVTGVMTQLTDVGSDVKAEKTEVTDVMTQLKEAELVKLKAVADIKQAIQEESLKGVVWLCIDCEEKLTKYQKLWRCQNQHAICNNCFGDHLWNTLDYECPHKNCTKALEMFPPSTAEKELLFIFVDNPNMWVEVKNTGILLPVKGHLDIGKLIDVIVQDREVAMVTLYGSEPPRTDSVWEKEKELRWSVTTRKKYTETQLTADIVKVVSDESVAKGKVVILSGNGYMIPAIKKGLAKDWPFDIWMWKSDVEKSLVKLEEENGELIKINFFDSDMKDPTFTNFKINIKCTPHFASQSVIITNVDFDPSKEWQRNLGEMLGSPVQCCWIGPKRLASPSDYEDIVLTFSRKESVDSSYEDLKKKYPGKVMKYPAYSEKFQQKEEISICSKYEELLHVIEELTVSSCFDLSANENGKESSRKRPCRYNFRCKYGVNCRFYHTQDEIKYFLNPHKDRKCWYKSNCIYGSRCKFAHSSDEGFCSSCYHWGHLKRECTRKKIG